MATDQTAVDDETALRGLIERRVQAVHQKSIEGALADLAPDALMFDVINPLQYQGVSAVKERVTDWFGAYPGAIGYEVRDLVFSVGDRTAFCHYLYHVTGTMAAGARVDMWVRATVCFEKTDGDWVIVHDHQSVPFDPTTGKASLDLKP